MDRKLREEIVAEVEPLPECTEPGRADEKLGAISEVRDED